MIFLLFYAFYVLNVNRHDVLRITKFFTGKTDEIISLFFFSPTWAWRPINRTCVGGVWCRIETGNFDEGGKQIKWMEKTHEIERERETEKLYMKSQQQNYVKL
jgi:hypothetical protein